MPLSRQPRLPPATVVADLTRAPDFQVPEDATKGLHEFRRLDDELAPSFPASGPPSWVLDTWPTPANHESWRVLRVVEVDVAAMPADETRWCAWLGL